MEWHVDTTPYSATEHSTWRHFFAAIEGVWAKYRAYIHPYYLEHAAVLQRFRTHVPSLAEVDDVLKQVGWRAVYVDGLAPPWEIARLIDQHIMPISRALRGANEVYFASGPDLIHDIFGHLPLLMSPEYRQLLGEWSHTASRLPVGATDRASYQLNKLLVEAQGRVDEASLQHLKVAASGIERYTALHPSPGFIFDKTYFWIFEFGMIAPEGQLKIMGAGLLSSLSEIERIATKPVERRPLDFASILSPYNISALQEGYLIAQDLQHCRQVLTDMRARVTLH